MSILRTISSAVLIISCVLMMIAALSIFTTWANSLMVASLITSMVALAILTIDR